jgi:hypothetical protein
MAELLKVAEDYSGSVISRMPANRLMVSPREPSRGRSPTPQGPTKHPSDVVKFNDLDGEFVVR